MARYVLDKKDIEPLLRGLAVFGTGGGGSPDFGRLIMEHDFTCGRQYTLVDPEDIADDSVVVSGGIMGSVKAVDTASYESIVDRWEKDFELLKAFQLMERFVGKKIDYIVPFELGGLNVPVMLSLGARMGVPVINGDALGRAAPETQMTSFLGHGVSITPMSMVDDIGNRVVVESVNDVLFPDRIGRWMVTHAGGMGANSHYPMTGRQLKESVVPKTITRALEIGRRMGQAREGRQSIAQLLAELVGGEVLVERGQISSIEEEDKSGWLHQVVRVVDKGEPDREFRIVVKNEAMLCFVNDSPVCMFPDLIMMLDPGTGKGVMTSELKIKQELSIVIAPCHPRLREAAQSAYGKEAFNPARYGYGELKYIPVELLSKESNRR